MTTRTCGDCQACCRLLPVHKLAKKANTRCQHQRFAKGCAIYDRRPTSCILWQCLWRADPECNLPRPDRCHYIVDIVPDYIEFENNRGRVKIEAIQIWTAPSHRNAHRCDRLLAYLDAQYRESGKIGLVRLNTEEVIVLLPPLETGHDCWLETHGANLGAEHTPAQIIKALAQPEKQDLRSFLAK